MMAPDGRDGYLKSREGIRGARSDRIDQLLSRFDRPSQPGLIVSVLEHGEVVHRRGYGVADVENDLPLLAESVLRLGSTSKHICCALLLLLEDEGKLSFEDDIRKFVPELPRYEKPVTLRHLATMTSGMRDGLSLLAFCGLATNYAVTRQQILDLQRAQRSLMFEPGDDFSYSNTNYNLLSLAIERVCDEPLGDVLSRQIFEPLGMHETRVVPDPAEVVDRRAVGYQPGADGRPVRGLMLPELCSDGGIDSTIQNMERWFLNYRNDSLFGPGFRGRMETRVRLNDGSEIGYALGLNVDEYRGVRRVSHAGGMPGFLADFAFYPEIDLGVVLLANWMDPDILGLADRVADEFLDDHAPEKPPAALELRRESLAERYLCREKGLLVEFPRRNGEVQCYVFGYSTPLSHEPEPDLWKTTRRGVFFHLRLVHESGEVARIEVTSGAKKKLLFEALRSTTAPDDLDAYVGSYWSHDLGETYCVSRSGAHLRMDLPTPVRTLGWSDLQPLDGDLFSCVLPDGEVSGHVVARFERDATGSVIAFVLNEFRCRDLRFERLGT